MSHLVINQIAEIKEFIFKQSLVNKEIMNLSEAAFYMNVSKSFIYKLTFNNEITFHKPRAKLIFFKKSDLDEFMLGNKVPSHPKAGQIPIPKRLK